MTKDDLIDRYFAGVHGRDIEAMVALFAEDAVLVLPDGRVLEGTAAIRGMYQHLFAADPPLPSPTAAIIGGDGLAVEIESRLDDGTARQTANFFYLDDGGLIRRLSIYRRS